MASWGSCHHQGKSVSCENRKWIWELFWGPGRPAEGPWASHTHQGAKVILGMFKTSLFPGIGAIPEVPLPPSSPLQILAMVPTFVCKGWGPLCVKVGFEAGKKPLGSNSHLAMKLSTPNIPAPDMVTQGSEKASTWHMLRGTLPQERS